MLSLPEVGEDPVSSREESEMKKSISRLGVLLLVAGLVLGAMSGVCAAPAADTQTVNLELTDVDAQAAIRMLFQSTGRNYSIGSDVTGTIPSVSFKDVSFDQALKTLLKSAGLVYRIEDAGGSSVYIISKKTAVQNTAAPVVQELPPVDTTATEDSTIEKVKLNNVGASEILQMMGAGGSSNANGFGNYGSFGSNIGGSSMGSSFGSGSSGSYGGNYGGVSYGSNYSSGSSRYSSGSSYGRSW